VTNVTTVVTSVSRALGNFAKTSVLRSSAVSCKSSFESKFAIFGELTPYLLRARTSDLPKGLSKWTDPIEPLSLARTYE